VSGSNPRVLVAGGGVGGPALALFLKKAGISCAVYEAYPYTEGVGGGLNLAPNGMNVLAALGLAENLTSRATIAHESVFAGERGKSLGRLPYGDPKRYGQPAVSMSRALLFGALAEELRRSEIPVHYEKRVNKVIENGDTVTISFTDGDSAQGDLLIGADGVRSAVRGYLLPDGPHPAYTGIIGIGGFAPLSALPTMPQTDVEALTYTFGPRGFFGYGGADGGTMMWWSNLWRKREFSHEELTNLDQRAIQDELLQRYRGYHEPIASLIRNTSSILRMNIYDILSLPTWRKGRVALIGDAAHAVSPNAGQGASMTLEDAMCLAMLLRDCGGHHTSAFAAFERMRKDRVEKIVAEGRRRGGDKEEVSAFQSRLRNTMMKFFLGRASEKSDDWLFSYRLHWNEKAM
jgi:2-polyprenyl-6-methoxyphenol hydroxylase-like FAD-dependent oxidoreductase